MRVLSTFFITILVVAIHLFDRPAWVVWVEKQLDSQIDQKLYVTELRFDGLKQLSRVEVERFLPKERNVAWWIANHDVVKGSLAQNPYIARAEISECADAAWGCFLISVEERVPKFLVSLESTRWTVSADGTFLRQLKNSESPPKDCITVSESNNFNDSPDQLKNAINASAGGLSILQEEIKKPVSALTFINTGEFEVSFTGLSFVVRFSAPEPDNEVQLKKEASRLAKIVKELGPNTQNIERIDLSYPRFAVLSTKST